VKTLNLFLVIDGNNCKELEIGFELRRELTSN